MDQTIINTVEQAWENRADINAETTGEVRGAVQAVLDALDSGEVRVAEKGDDGWVVNQWTKKAVLLGFRLNHMSVMSTGIEVNGRSANYFDKITDLCRDLIIL